MKYEGLCYTLRMNEKLSKAGIASLQFSFEYDVNLKMNTMVDIDTKGWVAILHHAGQLRRGNPVEIPCTTSYITKAIVEFGIFSKIQNSTGCSKEMIEGYDKCWEDTMEAKLKRKIGCIFPWTRFPLDDEEEICTEEDFYQGLTEDMVKAELQDKNENNCTLPCQFMTFLPPKLAKGAFTHDKKIEFYFPS